MNIKDRIQDNLISKILHQLPTENTKYGIKVYNGRAYKFSFSKHKTKSGVFYNRFLRVYLK